MNHTFQNDFRSQSEKKYPNAPFVLNTPLGANQQFLSQPEEVRNFTTTASQFDDPREIQRLQFQKEQEISMLKQRLSNSSHSPVYIKEMHTRLKFIQQENDRLKSILYGRISDFSRPRK